MTYWKKPPIIKIYEALGAIADDRINIQSNTTANVYSSSGNKHYVVTYDQASSSIMCNDNGSFWQGYLGYPAISYLLKTGIVPYSPHLAELLKDIPWKDINTKFKNDWNKTEEYCKKIIIERGGNLNSLLSEIAQIEDFLSKHPFTLLGKKIKPPTGY